MDNSIPYPGPTITANYFPNTVASYYWSSTTFSYTTYYAWYIDFKDGPNYRNSKSLDYHVRAVRGGQAENNLVDNGNQTVTDTSTGLMWEKDTARDEGGNYDLMTWQEALVYCKGLPLAGYSDWRLPTVKEFRSIANYATFNPSVNLTFFPNTLTSNYWSSTTYPYYPNDAWYKHFHYGYEDHHHKSSTHYVRAVRGGKSVSFGKLTVNIEPEGVRTAGAQWRRVGTATWMDSGFIESGVPSGVSTVEFKHFAGWVNPSNAAVTVSEGQETTTTGTYLEQDVLFVSKGDAACGGNTPCYQTIQEPLEVPGDAKLIKVTGEHYNEDMELAENHLVTIQGDTARALPRLPEPRRLKASP